MKKLLGVVIVLGALVVLCGCTDAGRAKLFALGDSAAVKCWSGGQLIFEGRSTGKVFSEQNSDGYFFKDAKDGTTWKRKQQI